MAPLPPRSAERLLALGPKLMRTIPVADPQPVPRIGYASVDRSDEFERFVTSRLVAKPRSHDQGDDEARGR